ncbi:MAG: glucuronate isomerase [Clostridiaceae bacterium]|nr:glucuronate isomerase [Clostridiaceae bacterium]
MKEFLGEDFLINNKTGQWLYDTYAKNMPIYDYHCHLSPEEIYTDKRFKNITEAWLYGDHYKWRLLRSNGIPEKYVTGDGGDYEKFLAWAETVPKMIGNPLYHWTHLELKRFFGIDMVLNPKNADAIWEKANKALQEKEFSARGLIRKSNVVLICTTDDPVDDLRYHKMLREEGDFETKVYPTFRPEASVLIDQPAFLPWFEKLQNMRRRKVQMFYDFLETLESRVDYFHEAGCRIADCSMEYIPYTDSCFETAKTVFEKAVSGSPVTKEEADAYKFFMLTFYGKLYAQRGWTMQLHLGVIRNLNSRVYRTFGPDMGFDSMSDKSMALNMAKFFDKLDSTGSLPKTILYNLNPKDNYMFATMAGNFPGEGSLGKVQYGAAWWYNDQRDGIENQMKTLANVGLLSNFLGMLTDSRSFLSYARHEYFRRVLCNLIGEWVEAGEYPMDEEMLAKIIKGICYDNAKSFFGLDMGD